MNSYKYNAGHFQLKLLADGYTSTPEHVLDMIEALSRAQSYDEFIRENARKCAHTPYTT